MLKRALILALLCGLGSAALAETAEDTLTPDQARASLRRAVEFFRKDVSIQGGYLWQYSADLAKREGEGKAPASVAWVQPPGTPSVGFAYLHAYERTGEDFLLDAARETAYALVQGQLRSGGWHYSIEFDPEGRTKFAYRKEPCNPDGHNTSTLDDNTTQSALLYLMSIDKVLGFKDEAIHEAALYGLEHLLGAQYPIGAWPQRFTGPPDPEKYPVKRASYPESWSRTFPKADYSGFYTFNDNTIADVIGVMFDAGRVYGDARYRASAEKAGEFILMAQMPEPQPAWAQQYDPDMHPAWARKFEPPAITGGESHGVMQTLMMLYRETGDAKYLEPIPRAIEYFEHSRLPGGKLARFYELETNKPLYFTKDDYQITYSSENMPTHYAFIIGSWLDSIRKELEATKAMTADELEAARTPKAEACRMSDDLARQAKAAVESLDERGAWVQGGRLNYQGDEDSTDHVIRSDTFASNVRVLSQFLEAAR
ncbi:MAG TPA: pectate lyase [Candidatus Hydrogenedentes bacterium]|nr:pectate lyase [Candidatus Hydrogenedentota bacterium]HPG65885.1 pectate lyase [Candidatus Hydrogenedentota bacterium]